MINNYDSVVACTSEGTLHSQVQGETSFTQTKRTVISFVMVFVALFSFIFAQGQSISNYTFETATTGTLQDLTSGNTSYLNGNLDDASGTVQAIGFNFNFMGVTYTHFSANSNGQMQLHNSSTATAIGTNVTTATGSAILAPFTGDNEVNNGLRYKVLGAAPNRTFVLEWNQFYVNYVNLSNAGNMQVWLEETTGKITYIYGNIYNSSTSSQTRSISIASSNTATTVGSITISSTPTFTVGSTLVSNTIAAGENPVGVTPIANIGSTTDGSRRYFTFTPISTVLGDVNSITFSGITANLTTVNWVDNATNEFGFMVTRATDAGFTQNVSSVIVLSTTSAGTGTSYVSNQTGLSAGTEYFYKVVAIVEAGQSTGVSGNQTTLNGATYYWVGTSTSSSPGPFATLANWNTSADGTGTTPTTLATSDTFIVDGDGSASTGGNVYISLAAATTIGQLKIISNTALSLESATTTTRTLTISGGAGEDFVVENGSTLSLLNATKATAIAFSGSGNVGTIAGVYNANVSTSNTINTTGGTGTLVTVTSTGVVNNSIVGSSGCLLGSVATLSFANGSSYTHSGFTTSNAYVPLATWGASSNIFITGGTTSTSLSNNAQTFGNFTYNSTTSTATMSAFTTSTTAVIQGNLSILATGALGGTGIFRATTSGTLTVNGDVFVTQGKFQASSTSGTVIANGNTTIAANGILELSTTGAGGFSQRGNLFTNNGVLTGTSGTLSFVNFTGSAAQTLAGSGTVLTNIASLNMQNTAGLTITHTNPIIVARVNLFQGTITNSNKITFGTGAAVNCTTQIGSAGLTTPGGSFDAAPTFNLGTGTYTLIYQQESVSRTTGFEIPGTRTVNNVTVNNTNGITLSGGDLTTVSSLALTNGIITTGSNTLILGDATTVGTLTGSSETAYVDGALTRSIANANTNSTYVSFPIGKSGVYTPIALAPTTTSIALFKAESFGSNSGTEDPSIVGLSATRRFEALPVSGTFTDINVRLSDAGIVSTNIPVQAPTASGLYSTAFGSTATFVAGPPITITSNFPVTSANYTGYLSYANSNACSGIPNPGNTIASTNAICLGTTVNLSLQNIPAGTGITYQWKSSTDGTNYTVITGATSATLSVTPTEATFYVCDVTCSAGPSTGTSTVVQITFSNSVIATTPGTRCGTGTVDLSAVPSAGATVKWYAAATGGTALASGASFTTPSISATTTYYAGAETSTSGSVIIGSANTLTGATTQPSAFVNRWPSYRIQTLYTADELNAAGLGSGDITSMSYFTTTLGDAATNSNFVVKIGTTSQTNMTTAWLPTTSYTTVYGPVTHTHTATGEQPINFNTPFNWDGVSNIVIEVMYNGADITNNAITYFTSTTNNMVVHSNSSGSSAASGTVTTARLNLKLNGQVACSSDRMPVVATVTAPPALNLSSSAATICESSSTSIVTLTSTVGDYTTYTWSPSTGVSGDVTQGWTFNPSITTNYTLTASQAPQNIINNGDFSNGLTGWTNFVANWIPVNANFLAANNEANITGITGAGGQPWYVQLNQIFTPAQIASLEVGSSYKITFSARSTVNNRSLKLFFGEDGGGFIPLYEQNYSISNTASNYETNVFTLGQTFGGMKLGFEMGLMNEDVFIDNVTLTKIIPSICNTTTSFNVTVNPRPTALTITPTPANVCVDVIQSLVANGGTIGGLTDSQIGTATTLTSATSQPTAFCNRFKHYWVQMVYTAAELTAAGVQPGNITALRFTTGAQGSANNVTDFKVRLGSTTNNVLTGFTSSGLTQVFSVATYPTVVGVNTIIFDTPYVWDGVSNIIVDMRQTGVDSINNSTTQYTATTGNTVVSAITSTTNAGGSDGFAGTLPSATTSVNRLNTTFVWDSSIPTTIEWSPITNLYTDAAATVAYVAGNNASTVYVKSPTVATTTYTVTASVPSTGCETTATVDVIVNPNTSNSTIATACDTYTWAVNGTTYTSSGIYTNVVGCHTETLDLTITPSSSLPTEVVSVCDTYTWAANGTTYTASGVYTSVTNCVTSTLDLTINVSPSDATTQTGDTLTATETGATYQWVTCDGGGVFTPIGGAMSQSYLVTAIGSYAVEVTKNGCTVRSACIDVTSLSGNTFDLTNLKYYPNPVVDIFTVKYDKEIESINVFDLSGRLVRQLNPKQLEVQVDMSELAAAMYIVKVNAGGKQTEIKVMKK
jgi:hypothetical protein